jgi:hypothetical protein
MINHEQYGLCFLKLSLNTSDYEYIKYIIELEVKNKNTGYGPRVLNVMDLKYCFRDIFLLKHQNEI